MGASTSSNTQGLSRPVMGLLYHFRVREVYYRKPGELAVLVRGILTSDSTFKYPYPYPYSYSYSRAYLWHAEEKKSPDWNF
jgi:hypothetical protein